MSLFTSTLQYSMSVTTRVSLLIYHIYHFSIHPMFCVDYIIIIGYYFHVYYQEYLGGYQDVFDGVLGHPRFVRVASAARSEGTARSTILNRSSIPLFFRVLSRHPLFSTPISTHWRVHPRHYPCIGERDSSQSEATELIQEWDQSSVRGTLCPSPFWTLSNQEEQCGFSVQIQIPDLYYKNFGRRMPGDLIRDSKRVSRSKKIPYQYW